MFSIEQSRAISGNLGLERAQHRVGSVADARRRLASLEDGAVGGAAAADEEAEQAAVVLARVEEPRELGEGSAAAHASRRRVVGAPAHS